jgi:superfamily I DNA/RNA helicase
MPTYKVFPDALTMFRAAIDAARRLVRESAKRHGRVSILCLDEERFETYSRAAEKQYETEAFIIASRDDTERLRYSGRKFLLSTPEYVAGLQFDTVILIDANKSLVPDGANTGYLMRRILSELYLGISRAERRLLVFASQDAGGISSLLGGVIAKGLLVEAKE